MAENYTTYTEHDIAAKLSINSTTSISFANIGGLDNEYAYLYKDYTYEHFDAFDIDVQFKIENVTQTDYRGGICILGLTNLTESVADGVPAVIYGLANYYAFYQGALELYTYMPSSGTDEFDIRFQNHRVPANDTDIMTNATLNTDYYCSVIRTSTATVANCYIYSDAARTVLVDTLTVTCHPRAYRYIYAMSSRRTQPSYRNRWWGYIKNLNIVSSSAVNIPTPSDTKAYDYTTFTQGETRCDIRNSRIVEVGHDHINGLKCNQNDRIYKDFGANYWDGDHLFLVNSIITDIATDSGGGLGFSIWALGDCTTSPRHSCWTDSGGNGIDVRMIGQVYGVSIYMHDWNGADNDIWDKQAVPNNYYFFTIQRIKSTNVGFCMIYSDDARTDLLTTLSITVAGNDYRNLFTLGNIYDAASAYDHYFGTIEYMKLGDISVPTDPGESGPSDGATNAEWDTSNLYIDIPESEEDVTIYFYDASDDSLIGVAEGSGGDTVYVPWDDLECEETYHWYVVIDNGISEATSVTWTFTCGPCDVFTISSESHPTIHLTKPRFRDGEDRQLSKEIQSFNFWSGNWATHDNGVSSEPLILVGEEWMLPTGDMHIMMAKFENINNLMNKHEEVAISGLGDCIDGYYYIKNFHYDTYKGSPYAKIWRIELEFSRVKTW